MELLIILGKVINKELEKIIDYISRDRLIKFEDHPDPFRQILPAQWNNMYYVYVLISEKDGNFYVGFTGDLQNRLIMHNSGKVDSTKTRIPLDLVYYEASIDMKDALKREKYLKTTYGRRYIRNRLEHFFKNDIH